jgi:hypothetical protein
MAISINPVDVIKIFRENGITKKQTIVSYIEAIASDARESANLWCTAIDAINDGCPQTKRDSRRRISICTNIDFQYQHASTALKGMVSDELKNSLFDALGAFI